MKPGVNAGTLYLIPATLGDLKGEADTGLLDASLPPAVRAKTTTLTAFAVENAKSARAFLKNLGMARSIAELDITEIGHTPGEKALKPLVDKLLGGVDVGVLAEAGCPGVADPGAQLVRMAHVAGVRVVPLIGPSSILLAVMASGLDGQRFAFAGYAPVKSPQREAALKKLETRSAREHETQILIETPYRNGALFRALLATLKGDTRLCVAIDLTLAGESVRTLRASEWRAAPPASATLDKMPAVFLFLAS